MQSYASRYMKAISKEYVELEGPPIHRIYREVAETALRLMDTWQPPEPELKVGDYVVVLDAVIGELLGRHGKIIELRCDSIFNVEFAEGYKLSSSLGNIYHTQTFKAEKLKKVP